MLSTSGALLLLASLPFVLGTDAKQPRDCQDIIKLNNTFEGHYVVYPNISVPQRPAIVYCSEVNGMSPLPKSLASRQLPKNCLDSLSLGGRTGINIIFPFLDKPENPVLVMCDMDTDGGGWTVFHHRFDGSVEFYRDWLHYEEGFGNPNEEHYLGNEVIAALTGQAPSELRVDLEAFSGETRYANYKYFNVDPEDKYRLHIGFFSGTAPDSMRANNDMQFSTYDQDNDLWPNSCARYRRGAWWYNYCGGSSLTSYYFPTAVDPTDVTSIGMWWGLFGGYSLRRSKMMTRPYCYST